MVLSDQGRRGYVFIRIKEKEIKEKIVEEGVMDINLYNLDEDLELINTDGILINTYCTSLR